MKPLTAQPLDAGEAGRGGWLWALLALVIGLIALSSQSLWIDEALTAVKASQPTFADWWRVMQASRDSDLQMPVYMGYMFGFARIFGTSEWVLRAANLPWFVAGVAAFATVPPRPFKYLAGLAALLSPFAWYYLDEARPYAMQLGVSLVIFAALFRLREGGLRNQDRGVKFWLAVFLAGLVVLCGSSLLGMVWAIAPVLALPVLLPPDQIKKLVRRCRLAVVIGLVCLVVLAGYYLWTLQVGARASAAAGTDAAGLFYLAYELLGFAGLGPGRLAIRAEGLRAFLPFAPLLALYGAVLLMVLWLGAVKLWCDVPRRILLGALVALLVPAVVLIAAGVLLHFRVLARHFTPVLPVLLALVSAGLTCGRTKPRFIPRVEPWIFLLLALVSCLSLRFAPRHAKDDYRAAVAAANAALQAGHRVWWSASLEGAAYYRVPVSGDPAAAGTALAVINPPAGFADRLPPPDVIVASKPDVYDSGRALAGFLARGGWSREAVLPAFTIWQRVDNK